MPTATSPTPNPDIPIPSTLPPPQVFDLIPHIHALLARLLLPNTQHTAQDISTPSSSITANSTVALSPKDLATAASGVMVKIQKARNAVRDLPGVQVGLDEQERIIRDLEEEVRRLNEVEVGIGRAARRSLKDEISARGQDDVKTEVHMED